MKQKISREFLDAMSREPGNWRGPFYFNRKDPRLLVPKLNPALGWTLNFASPNTYVTLVVLLAVIIIVSFLA